MPRKITSNNKWRVGPLLLLAILTAVFLAPPFIATLSAEPRVQRIVIANGARPEFLKSTLLDIVGEMPITGGADMVLFVFADKREYDVAAVQLGSPRLPLGICDIMVAWLGCRPLQILRTFGVKKTGEIIDTSLSSVPNPCREDDAIPSSTAALLASNSGEFLLAAAGKLLHWGADDEGLFAHDAKVVVMQPSDAVLCRGHARAGAAQFESLSTCNRDCLRLVSLGKSNASHLVNTLPYVVDSGAAMVRWWRREHPPARRQHQRLVRAFNANDSSPLLDLTALAKPGYGAQIDWRNIELFSPIFFLGTLHAVAKFSDLVQVALVESPIPPGYPHEIVIASVVQSLRDRQWLRDSNRWLNIKPFTVNVLPPLEFPVGSRETCWKERACRSRAIKDDSPIAFIRPFACPKQRPQQAPWLTVPCRSGMYDDFYLLHRGIVNPVNATTQRNGSQFEAAVIQPMEALPVSLIPSSALTRRWKELSNDAVAASTLRRCRAGNARLGASLVIAEQQPANVEASECSRRSLNAVLGVCGSFEPSVVSGFVRSFVKFHKRGCTKLLLFVDEELLPSYQAAYGTLEDIEVLSTRPLMSSLKLKDCGVAVFRTELLARWMDSNSEVEERDRTAATGEAVGQSPQGTATPQPSGQRTTPPPYRYVMMVDTRDTFFQSDPFKHVEGLSQKSSSAKVASPSRSVVFVVAERFDAASLDLYNPIVFDFHERLAGASCGLAAVQWSYRLRVAPIPTPSSVDRAAHKGGTNKVDADGRARGAVGSGEWAAVEPLPIVCLGLMFGTYDAVRDLLHLLAESLVARIVDDPQLCGVNIDQGMLNCLLYGGLAHANYAHDVVLLNPYTLPYTHGFRSYDEIAFGKDAVSSSGYKYLQSCQKTPRRSGRYDRPTESSPLAQHHHFAVVHQADRMPETYFYATEVLTQSEEEHSTSKQEPK